jgi:hypothetical protein
MTKYQLINPKICDKVYESNNYKKCAKIFYNYVKQDSKDHKLFVMKNIDTGKLFHFAITGKQVGGEQNNENPQEEDKLTLIENRLEIIEKKLNINQKVPECNTMLCPPNNNEPICVIQ